MRDVSTSVTTLYVDTEGNTFPQPMLKRVYYKTK